LPYLQEFKGKLKIVLGPGRSGLKIEDGLLGNLGLIQGLVFIDHGFEGLIPVRRQLFQNIFIGDPVAFIVHGEEDAEQVPLEQLLHGQVLDRLHGGEQIRQAIQGIAGNLTGNMIKSQAYKELVVSTPRDGGQSMRTKS
jgi:hypothetical protein